MQLYYQVRIKSHFVFKTKEEGEDKIKYIKSDLRNIIKIYIHNMTYIHSVFHNKSYEIEIIYKFYDKPNAEYFIKQVEKQENMKNLNICLNDIYSGCDK